MVTMYSHFKVNREGKAQGKKRRRTSVRAAHALGSVMCGAVKGSLHLPVGSNSAGRPQALKSRVSPPTRFPLLAFVCYCSHVIMHVGWICAVVWYHLNHQTLIGGVWHSWLTCYRPVHMIISWPVGMKIGACDTGQSA